MTAFRDDTLRLELQSAMFDIVDQALRQRSGPDLPDGRQPASNPTGTVDAFEAHVATLDLDELAGLRRKLATAFLHEVDRGLATGRLRAMNEEML